MKHLKSRRRFITRLQQIVGWRRLALPAVLFCAAFPAAFATAASAGSIAGTYDVGTLTPLERPEAFGEKMFLTEAEAEVLTQRMAAVRAADSADSDPNRSAPEQGGQVGGYNFFWIDPGSTPNTVDGKFRTSIIVHPQNGRIPDMTAQGARRMQSLLDTWQIIWRNPDPTTTRNSGTAWWLEFKGPAPYDNLEQRPLAERCIIGSRSTAGPPMLPNLYNNHKRIIVAPDHVMILTEMNHDARVVRLNSEHRERGFQTWLGDSIGHWEGDTLVVDTTNFKDTPPLSGADANLQVIEWFTPLDNGDLSYRFEVRDPTVWSDVWRGEYTWRKSDGKVYEYACHEGNYAIGNIMRGARLLEADARGG